MALQLCDFKTLQLYGTTTLPVYDHMVLWLFLLMSVTGKFETQNMKGTYSPVSVMPVVSRQETVSLEE